MADEYVSVGRIEEFPEGKIRGFDLDGLDVAVVSWREQFYAFSNRCTHNGFPFDDGGFVTPDNELICTSHFACYDLKTGELVDGPGFSGIMMYEVYTEDGEVRVVKSQHRAS